jgi:hypothetical protein
METSLLAGSSRHRGSIPGRADTFYPSAKISTGSGAYPALCSVGTGNAFPENVAAGT